MLTELNGFVVIPHLSAFVEEKSANISFYGESDFVLYLCGGLRRPSPSLKKRGDMRCPKCGKEKQRVIETRPFGEETYRKRECVFCCHVFITYEKADVLEDKKVFVRKPR